MEKVQENKECGKTFFDTKTNSEELKKKTILMHLNNVGIRKKAMFIGLAELQ